MSHYCRWCDTLVNVVVKEYDKNGYAIWIGCNGCYKKKEKSKNEVPEMRK